MILINIGSSWSARVNMQFSRFQHLCLSLKGSLLSAFVGRSEKDEQLTWANSERSVWVFKMIYGQSMNTRIIN